ncbi:MAG: hypothetical protein IKH14_03090 [Prevotella sp.]|nr:hypothetical protein [Prevotella sp.]
MKHEINHERLEAYRQWIKTLKGEALKAAIDEAVKNYGDKIPKAVIDNTLKQAKERGENPATAWAFLHLRTMFLSKWEEEHPEEK